MSRPRLMSSLERPANSSVERRSVASMTPTELDDVLRRFGSLTPSMSGGTPSRGAPGSCITDK